ncbi:MAG TPA: ABC transporter permease [Jiangellales bacterium]|nr:ABC transporter permease [Jiangellales bacterium]
MRRFVVARLVQTVVTLFLVVTALYIAVTVLPGDPVRALFGVSPPPPELYSQITAFYELDQPLLVQYVHYLGRLLTGDLGRSYPADPFGVARVGPPVTTLVAAAASVSAVIVVGALVVQAVVGLVVGLVAAVARGHRSRGLVYAVALLMVATPVLVVAVVSRSVMGFHLGLLPSTGIASGPESYVLPILSLAALSVGYVALITRSELLASLASPYVRAARARGLPPHRVTGVHALRPSLVAVATFLAANVGQMITALVIVEGVFGIPGIGGLLFNAIQTRDRNLMVGIVLVIAVTVIVANALADVAVALLDPRVRTVEDRP